MMMIGTSKLSRTTSFLTGVVGDFLSLSPLVSFLMRAGVIQIVGLRAVKPSKDEKIFSKLGLALSKRSSRTAAVFKYEKL